MSIKTGYCSHCIVNIVSRMSIKAGHCSHFIVNIVSRVYKGWELLSFYCEKCSAISCQEQVTFDEMMMMSTLYQTITLSWIFIVLTY